ncbi:LysR family transcriptional regulator [Vibrio astriarenae]|uniref:LysR family transcriptional regulator n=1 Tax=Vibrio astriarenae TaxID=1481923 RepID=UPI0037351A8D
MNLSDLSQFVRIVETGSITETASQLEMTPAAVSTGLKRLEKQLGAQLIIRTTRRLRLTLEGEKFLYHCREALESIEQGRLALRTGDDKVSGNLRLSVPSDLGRNTILLWLDELIIEHPELTIDLTIGDTLSDFYSDGVDAALRYGKPEDSSLIAFHIADIPRVTCASPGYLEQYGVPKTPGELSHHNCLLHRRDGRLFDSWEYQGQSGTERVKVMGNRASDDTDIVKRWALQHSGVIHRSLLDVIKHIEQGRLVRLLSDYSCPSIELNLICPSRGQVTPSVIVFRELLRKRLKKIDLN